jgi:hypothetical protein
MADVLRDLKNWLYILHQRAGNVQFDRERLAASD